MAFVKQYEIIISYTGYAPATLRQWTSAVQNSEKQSSFACDCNNGEPVYFCQRVRISDAGVVGWSDTHLTEEIRSNPRLADNTDIMRCSFGWNNPGTSTDLIGLYMWSETKDFRVLETDIFDNQPYGSHFPTARQMVQDRPGMTRSLLKSLVFQAPGKLHQLQESYFPTSCLRWPYGQVSRLAFTPDAQQKWWPKYDPRTRVDTKQSTSGGGVDYQDAMMGYCDRQAGKPVYCRRDAYTADDRNTFCDNNPMASYVVAGVVLRETRTFEQTCSPDGLLCIYVPGYDEVGSLISLIDSDYVKPGATILVTPFNSTILSKVMSTQWYRTIGNPRSQPEASRPQYALVQEWDQPDTSPIGIGSDEELVEILANAKYGVNESNINRVVSLFWQHLTSTSRRVNDGGTCAQGEVVVPAGNGGKDATLCEKADSLQHILVDSGIYIQKNNIRIASAVDTVPMRFGGIGTRSACTRFYVQADNFDLGSSVFDQSACEAESKHTTIPVILTGVSAKNFTAASLSVAGAHTPVAALGGYDRALLPRSDIVDIDGFEATISKVDDGGAITACAAFARAVGMAAPDCSDPLAPDAVIVQSANASWSVDLTGAGTKIDIINVSTYLAVFGAAEERKLFHRSPQHTTSLWVGIVVLSLLATGLIILHVLLWVEPETVGGVVLRRVCRNTPNEFSPKLWEIKKDVIKFEGGVLQGKSVPFWKAAAAVNILKTTEYSSYPTLVNVLKQTCKS